MAAMDSSAVVVKAHSIWTVEKKFVLTGHFTDSCGCQRFYKCRELHTDKEFLLKKIRLVGSDVTTCLQDLNTWSQLRHAHILGYRDAWVSDDVQHILCEPAQMCLSVLLVEMAPQRPCPRLFPVWIFQILSAVEYMHERNNEDQPVLHRSLHPDNVLVTSRCVLKLCHFRVAKRLDQPEGTTQTVIGQGLFQCPEVQQGKPYDKSADIWSFAVTAVCIADIHSALRAATAEKLKSIVKQRGHLPVTQDVISSALQYDPSKRPKASSLVSKLSSVLGEEELTGDVPVSLYPHPLSRESTEDQQVSNVHTAVPEESVGKPNLSPTKNTRHHSSGSRSSDVINQCCPPIPASVAAQEVYAFSEKSKPPKAARRSTKPKLNIPAVAALTPDMPSETEVTSSHSLLGNSASVPEKSQEKAMDESALMRIAEIINFKNLSGTQSSASRRHLGGSLSGTQSSASRGNLGDSLSGTQSSASRRHLGDSLSGTQSSASRRNLGDSLSGTQSSASRGNLGDSLSGTQSSASRRNLGDSLSGTQSSASRRHLGDSLSGTQSSASRGNLGDSLSGTQSSASRGNLGDSLSGTQSSASRRHLGDSLGSASRQGRRKQYEKWEETDLTSGLGDSLPLDQTGISSLESLNLTRNLSASWENCSIDSSCMSRLSSSSSGSVSMEIRIPPESPFDSMPERDLLQSSAASDSKATADPKHWLHKENTDTTDNLLSSFIRTSGTQTDTQGKPLPMPPIFSEQWQAEATFSSSGGTLQKSHSDVILNIPSGALESDKYVTIYCAISADVERISRLLPLRGELMTSPMAEFWAGNNFRFKEPVQILLANGLPSNAVLKFVTVYRVTCASSGQTMVTKLRHKSLNVSQSEEDSGRRSSQELQAETSQGTTADVSWDESATFQFCVDGKLMITTDAFSGYVCTYCGQHNSAPLVLQVLASGNHRLKGRNRHMARVDVHVWDDRLAIRDFKEHYGIIQQGCSELDQTSLVLTRDLPNSQISFSLKVIGEEESLYWKHCPARDGSPGLPEEQIFDVERALGCDNIRCQTGGIRVRPLSVKWQLESSTDSPSNLWFRCVVEIRHIVHLARASAEDSRYGGSLSVEMEAPARHDVLHQQMPNMERLSIEELEAFVRKSRVIPNNTLHNMRISCLNTLDYRNKLLYLVAKDLTRNNEHLHLTQDFSYNLPVHTGNLDNVSPKYQVCKYSQARYPQKCEQKLALAELPNTFCPNDFSRLTGLPAIAMEHDEKEEGPCEHDEQFNNTCNHMLPSRQMSSTPRSDIECPIARPRAVRRLLPNAPSSRSLSAALQASELSRLNNVFSSEGDTLSSQPCPGVLGEDSATTAHVRSVTQGACDVTSCAGPNSVVPLINHSSLQTQPLLSQSLRPDGRPMVDVIRERQELIGPSVSNQELVNNLDSLRPLEELEHRELVNLVRFLALNGRILDQDSRIS